MKGVHDLRCAFPRSSSPPLAAGQAASGSSRSAIVASILPRRGPGHRRRGLTAGRGCATLGARGGQTPAEEAETLMPEFKVTVQRNGPLRIEGENLQILDPEGNAYGLGGRTGVALCRCGASNNKPFCD